VKTFRWNAAKNKRLQRERGVSFEEIVIAIGEGGLLDVWNIATRADTRGRSCS
jgi:uncharacterized DUF497 family protein